ncbi:MAG: LytTR family transcriptional regulator [Saprospiraceae bacterium]|nr:LytTR family transcriptional regulator [Saprospiraceae bacterium]
MSGFISSLDKNIRSTLGLALLMALFLIFALNFLEPFTIRNAALDLRFAVLISGYGIISGIILLFNELCIFPFLFKYFPHRYQYVSKQIGQLFILALGVYLYSDFLHILFPVYHFPAFSYLQALEKTLLLGILPFGGLALYKYFQARQKHSFQQQLPSEILHLQGFQSKDWLRVGLQELLFIESSDNYVTIYYLDGQKINRKLLRGSLKHFENQLAHLPIERCHHSYIVNLLIVSHIEGNLKGMKLHLLHCEQAIPVSRKYAADILEKMEMQKEFAFSEA